MQSHSTMKISCLTASVLCLAVTGCASFNRPKSDAFGGTTAKPGFVESLSSATRGIGGQVKSVGTVMSSAFSKTKQAVSNTFSPTKGDEDDPTSLSSMPSPTSLGPEIWVTNGQLYESQGQFAKALDNYTKALELEPNNESALISTARLYARQEKHSQAAEFFTKAIAVAPKADTYNDYSLALSAMGRGAEAEGAARKAIELAPSTPKFRNNLANMLVKNGRSDDAVRELQNVFSPAVANYNVAYLNYQNQNLAAAQQHLQVALQQEPNLELARDLMQKISGSSAMQHAVAAYQTADSLYRTAEAVVQPQISANQAVYQLPPPGSSNSSGAVMSSATGTYSNPTTAPAMGNNYPSLPTTNSLNAAPNLSLPTVQ